MMFLKSEIITAYPLDDSLARFRDVYDIFDAINYEKDAKEIEKRLLQFLAVLQTHSICFEFSSDRRQETLFDNLLTFFSEVHSK